MTEPHPRQKERPSRAVALASALALVRCRLHHGEFTEDDMPKLTGRAGVVIPDVMDALAKMLQMQLGAPITTVVTPTAEDAWQLAEMLAANADYDTEMFRRAAQMGRERAYFWDAVIAFDNGRDVG